MKRQKTGWMRQKTRWMRQKTGWMTEASLLCPDTCVSLRLTQELRWLRAASPSARSGDELGADSLPVHSSKLHNFWRRKTSGSLIRPLSRVGAKGAAAPKQKWIRQIRPSSLPRSLPLPSLPFSLSPSLPLVCTALCCPALDHHYFSFFLLYSDPILPCTLSLVAPTLHPRPRPRPRFRFSIPHPSTGWAENVPRRITTEQRQRMAWYWGPTRRRIE